MNAESGAGWTADTEDTVRDADTAENSLHDARRQLTIALRRAAGAKQAANRAQASPWWRVSAPIRVPVHRLRARSKTRSRTARQEAATGPTPAGPSVAAAPPDRQQQAVLHARLRIVLTAYGQSSSTMANSPLPDVVKRITALLDDDGGTELLWLLHIAFLSRYPTPSDMDAIAADLDLVGAAEVVSQLANAVQKTPQSWATSAPIVLVAAPVVEATRTTRFRFHSGVPRVVRTVAPIWSDENDLVLAVMDRRAGVLREPTQFEFDHVMRWADDLPNEPPAVEPTPTAILVPWRTTVIIPEITGMPPRPEYLAAMGRDSGNELAVLLYDLIPYTVPELVNPRMTARFSNLISVIRTSRRISAISESVAQDFLGLSRSFASQGIEPPTVRAHPLPIHAHAVSPEVQADCERRLIGVPGLPLVLSVSSLEPRKNQTTVLLAAERLWRDGLAFQLVFIAANSWMNDTFDEVLAELLARGRPIRIINQASEDLLWSAYRVARFTVFVPFAEGFGLPAAESIAAGTPVVLSNHGSMAEIGRYGGAAMVSPYDLGQVSDAMRRLLTDDTYLAELEEQAQARTTGNWETYARSTWDWLARGLD